MEKTISASGTCLCGAVKITASEINPNLGVCHCNMCRKWSAGPYLSVDCGQKVTIEGKDSLAQYDSSEWASRGFCNKCGTSLFYYLKPKSQYIVSSEIFRDQKFNFDHEIFIDEKPAYYDFANDTKKMTGEEVFKAFAP